MASDAETLEELQLDYDDKCNELADTQAELRAAKIETQQLRLRLQAAGIKDTSLVPPEIRAGPGAAAPVNTQTQELRRHLQWLAEYVKLEEPVSMHAGIDLGICMGGRRLQLEHVVQWRLRFPGDLKLSVPTELAAEIEGLLVRIKSKGNVADEEMLESLSKTWEPMMTEMVHGPNANPEPVLMLVNKLSSACLLIATWPSPPSLCCPPSFWRSSSANPWAVGRRVEVLYEEQWYAGVLSAIDEEGIAHVQCDVDPPDVMTKVLLCGQKLRVSQTAESEEKDPCSDNMATPVPPSHPSGHRRTPSTA